jgi:Phosphotransferase enzyme family
MSTFGTDTSGPTLGAGREADVYAMGDSAVLKLYRPGFGGHRAEAITLRSLEGRGIAPKLLEVREMGGRTGLLEERLAGPDLLTLLQHRPWRLYGVARLMTEAHLAVHRVPAPAELADQRLVLADRVRDAALPRHLFEFVSRVLDELPDGDRLSHGDFHPGNVMLTADGTAVIDWGAATRATPEADHARTLLLLRWADPLPGTPLVSRTVIATGRSALAHAYVRAYRRGSPPLRQVRSWLVVHLAARLSEGIPAERSLMIGRLARALQDDPG